MNKRNYRIYIRNWDHKVIYECDVYAAQPQRTKKYKEARALWQAADEAYILSCERIDFFIP